MSGARCQVSGAEPGLRDKGHGTRVPRYPEKRRKNVIKRASRLSEILILNVSSKFS